MEQTDPTRWPAFGLAFLSATLAGCGGQLDAAFTGAALGAGVLILTLGVLNYLTRGKTTRSAQIIRTVVIALLLLTMIALILVIVLGSGIGRI